MKAWARERWHRFLLRLSYDWRITIGAPHYRDGWKAIHSARFPIDLSPLVLALQAGNYNGVKGGSLVIEDLSCVMECVTFDAPWPDPKWYQIWKWASKDYMFLLRYQQKSTSIKFRSPKKP